MIIWLFFEFFTQTTMWRFSNQNLKIIHAIIVWNVKKHKQQNANDKGVAK